jgi:1-aminocyclopropane-1-carboxylate deaminase/D-cysteine desulfhydrase-like pyridoxal-dependent ACC family enzyme
MRGLHPAAALAAGAAVLPRASLATLPTPLEPGPPLPGGARLWVKRDDLTGLGLGGNKARKLELLCGAALAAGADVLVTAGAGQSNHCRTTAAAGARLGLPVHLVLGGPEVAEPAGNQLLSRLFGAHQHMVGTSAWPELEAAKDALCARLEQDGARPYGIPIGGSTPVGAVGFALAWRELMEQCADEACRPSAVVHATSSGATHAGLLAGRAVYRAAGLTVPDLVAVAVAKGIVLDETAVVGLARETLGLLGLESSADALAPLELRTDELGPDYGVPTAEGDAALHWAARHGGWVLDRTYTAKALAAVLALADAGRWAPGDDVVFWHTGGVPSLFAPGGYPTSG